MTNTLEATKTQTVKSIRSNQWFNVPLSYGFLEFKDQKVDEVTKLLTSGFNVLQIFAKYKNYENGSFIWDVKVSYTGITYEFTFKTKGVLMKRGKHYEKITPFQRGPVDDFMFDMSNCLFRIRKLDVDLLDALKKNARHHLNEDEMKVFKLIPEPPVYLDVYNFLKSEVQKLENARIAEDQGISLEQYLIQNGYEGKPIKEILDAIDYFNKLMKSRLWTMFYRIRENFNL